MTVAVVGSGAAGLMACATLIGDQRLDSSEIVLVTDRNLASSNSVMAQGGLHVPFDTADSKESMLADMEAIGGSIDVPRAQAFVEQINATISDLQGWGLSLDRDGDGLRRRIAGGMSEPRIVGSGDSIGKAVMSTLRRVVADSQVTVLTQHTVTDVIRNGSLVLRTDRGEIVCDAAVVATGGISRRRAEALALPTTNPPNRNQVLYEILVKRCGEVDPDVFQYQPFGLVDVPDRAGAGHAVPETIVEYPQIVLLDSDCNEIVDMRAGREAITNAMFATVRDGRGYESNGRFGCKMTLARLDVDIVQANFPALARRLERSNLLGRDVLVEPHLHYQLGGVACNVDGSTKVPGLFVAGELCGGLHGRGRLMGNGLTDSLVHGKVAALSAIDLVADTATAKDDVSPS